jgi:hypothetical protein
VAQGGKCLVIDTDIARSAGGVEAHEERSKCCRDFLIAIRDTTHKLVTTEATREEWHKHQSKFTKVWMASMIARRRICWIEAPPDEELRRKIEQGTAHERKRNAMLKDIHLVEAALQADKIVVSLDETVRACFHETTQHLAVLRTLMWVNPCRSEETPVEWLNGGAKLEKIRLLGYTKENE